MPDIYALLTQTLDYNIEKQGKQGNFLREEKSSSFGFDTIGH
jgi:hypothetical protein